MTLDMIQKYKNTPIVGKKNSQDFTKWASSKYNVSCGLIAQGPYICNSI